MDGPKDCPTKWSKSDTERQISYDTTYTYNLKKNSTNELIYKNKNRVTDGENKLMVTREERGGRDKLGGWD